MLTEGSAAAVCLQKMEVAKGCVDGKNVDGISAAACKVDGRRRKVPQSHRMSAEGSENVQKLTEGPAAARKVDGRFLGHT